MPELPKKCLKCGSTVAPTDQFCIACGQRLVTQCPHCDHNVSISSDRCAYCGGAVDHGIARNGNPPSDNPMGDILRIRAEMRVLEERAAKKVSVLPSLIKTLLLTLFEAAIFAVILGFVGYWTWGRFQNDFVGFYESRRRFSVIGGGILAIGILGTIWGVIGRHWKSHRERIAREISSRESARERLEEAKKKMERMASP